MKKEGESHLPAPLTSCPCRDDGLILTTPLKTSMVTNEYICIFESHSSPYLFQEFIYSHLNVPHLNVSHFTPSYNEIVIGI
jgi:hypothetical protein